MYVIMLCPFLLSLCISHCTTSLSLTHTHTHTHISVLFRSTFNRMHACVRYLRTTRRRTFHSGSVFPPTTSACMHIHGSSFKKNVVSPLVCCNFFSFSFFIYIPYIHTYIHTVYINCTAGCSRHSLSALSSLVQSSIGTHLNKKDGAEVHLTCLLFFVYYFLWVKKKKRIVVEEKEARRGEERGEEDGGFGGDFFRSDGRR